MGTDLVYGLSSSLTRLVRLGLDVQAQVTPVARLVDMEGSLHITTNPGFYLKKPNTMFLEINSQGFRTPKR